MKPMNQQRRYLAAAMSIVLAAAAVYAAGNYRSTSAPLRIGTCPWPTFIYLHLAAERGFFDDEGLGVQLVPLGSQADVRRAFERGQVDVFCGSLIELLQIRDLTDLSPQIITLTDWSDGADVLLAGNEIKTLADLKGKRIGVEIATLGPFVLQRALQTVGLRLEDVTLVPLHFGDEQFAIQQGTIDAVVTFPPVSTAILRSNNVQTMFTSAAMPGEICGTLSADAQLIRDRRPEMQALRRVYQRAVQYARRHPQETEAYLAKQLGISDAEVSAALAGIHIIDEPETVTMLALQGPVEQTIVQIDQLLRQTGQIRGPRRIADCIPKQN